MLWKSSILSCLCFTLGCATTTEVTGPRLAPETARELRIGSLEAGYGKELQTDRRVRAQRYGLANQVTKQVEVWMTEVGRWSGPDRARIDVVRFRLPAPGGRWAGSE